MLDLAPEVDELWDELNEAVRRVMRSGQFIMGPEVSRFEDEVAAYLGAEHAVGVNSGTDALVVGLRALGVGPGDEVITTPFTFFATAESISMVGAEPVFVDVRADSFNIDPAKVEAAITPRTKAVMPVHLYGNPAAMTQLVTLAEAHGLNVIEDGAQSFGARYHGDCTGCRGRTCDDGTRQALVGRAVGTIGDVGAFSFFPTKNLGAYGDGGVIVTDDEGVAEHARMLRAHGSKKKYQNEMLGYNSRLDAMQAAILRVKLPHVDRYNEHRRAIAKRYNEAFEGGAGVVTPGFSDGHVFHQYTLRVREGRRDDLRQRLSESGISSKVYYPIACHKLPVYAGDGSKSLPVTERLEEEVLSLPIWPQMSSEVQQRVIDVIRAKL